MKELIPELFYLSEMFKNENNYDLGTMSENGHQVDDVVLPNWAKVCTQTDFTLISPPIQPHFTPDFLFRHQKILSAFIDWR